MTNPVISAIGMNYCNPEAISLTSVPMSIYSQYNLSDSGCYRILEIINYNPYFF